MRNGWVVITRSATKMIQLTSLKIIFMCVMYFLRHTWIFFLYFFILNFFSFLPWIFSSLPMWLESFKKIHFKTLSDCLILLGTK